MRYTNASHSPWTVVVRTPHTQTCQPSDPYTKWQSISWLILMTITQTRDHLIDALTARPNDLSSILQPTEWEKRTDANKLCFDFHRCTVVPAHKHTHTQNIYTHTYIHSCTYTHIYSHTYTLMLYTNTHITYAYTGTHTHRATAFYFNEPLSNTVSPFHSLASLPKL